MVKVSTLLGIDLLIELTTLEESRPPLKNAPTGTSLLMRSRTESSKRPSNSSKMRASSRRSSDPDG
jgi:hypothetical protein